MSPALYLHYANITLRWYSSFLQLLFQHVSVEYEEKKAETTKNDPTLFSSYHVKYIFSLIHLTFLSALLATVNSLFLIIFRSVEQISSPWFQWLC